MFVAEQYYPKNFTLNCQPVLIIRFLKGMFSLPIGGSWHGNKDRLLTAAAGVNTHFEPF